MADKARSRRPSVRVARDKPQTRHPSPGTTTWAAPTQPGSVTVLGSGSPTKERPVCRDEVQITVMAPSPPTPPSPPAPLRRRHRLHFRMLPSPPTPMLAATPNGDGDVDVAAYPGATNSDVRGLLAVQTIAGSGLDGTRPPAARPRRPRRPPDRPPARPARRPPRRGPCDRDRAARRAVPLAHRSRRAWRKRRSGGRDRRPRDPGL